MVLVSFFSESDAFAPELLLTRPLLLLELGTRAQICIAGAILRGTSVVLLVDVLRVRAILTNNPVCSRGSGHKISLSKEKASVEAISYRMLITSRNSVSDGVSTNMKSLLKVSSSTDTGS